MIDSVGRQVTLDGKGIEAIRCEKYEYATRDVQPDILSTVCGEVADSWSRCKQSGLLPSTRSPMPRVVNANHEETERSHLLLNNAAKGVLQHFADGSALSGGVLFLIDPQMVIVASAGQHSLGDLLPDKGSMANYSLAEEYWGTSAHTISLRLGKTVQLVGPEHYLEALESFLTSAAPITDQNGRTLGCLTLIRPLSLAEMLDQKLRQMDLNYLMMLAWIISREGQLQILQSKEHQFKGTLDAVLSFIDDGVIVIDREGCIQQINGQGKRILGVDRSACGTISFDTCLKKDSPFAKLILSGHNLNDTEDVLFTQNGNTNCRFSVRPIANHGDHAYAGSVIRINDSKKLIGGKYNSMGTNAIHTFETIFGSSTSLENTKKEARLFAPTDASIVLIGESGTGKELFAQAIHNASRPRSPFVAVNCAALPRNLVESELFGYEGGAFTGAERKGRIGKIEMANGGTLFLDEIGDMPYDIQTVFLRVLEDKCVTRIGATATKAVDFRLIIATNQDLDKLIEIKQFRADLYYRISTAVIRIPPLREREDDTILLAKHFVDDFCMKRNLPPIEISPSVLGFLTTFAWPGNVRQLQKCVKHAADICRNSIITMDDIPREIRDSISTANDIPRGQTLTLKEMECRQIQNALQKTNNDVAQAAEILGMGRSTLYKRLKEYSIPWKHRNRGQY